MCRYEARAVARNAAAFTKIAPLTFRPPRIAAAIAKECADLLFQVGHAGIISMCWPLSGFREVTVARSSMLT